MIQNKPIADPKAEVRWYVMRAYKNESKAEEKLSGEYGLPYFIPKIEVERTYHGKKSKRLIPAIPSIIFVKASRQQIADFKTRCPFLQYVMWKKSTGYEYMIVPDHEMENFIRVATHATEPATYYAQGKLDLKKGTRIRIKSGPLEGTQGYFIKVQGVRNRQFVVNLDGIVAASIKVNPEDVAPLEE